MSDDRLQRIEEQLAFVERAVESLSEEAAAASARARAIERRLDALDALLRRLIAPVEDPSEDS